MTKIRKWGNSLHVPLSKKSEFKIDDEVVVVPKEVYEAMKGAAAPVITSVLELPLSEVDKLAEQLTKRLKPIIEQAAKEGTMEAIENVR